MTLHKCDCQIFDKAMISLHMLENVHVSRKHWHVNQNSVAHTFAGPSNPGADSKDITALWHFRNHNLNSEIPYISTRRPQTPDKGKETLCAKCTTGSTKKRH